jgi:hypothetical protein
MAEINPDLLTVDTDTLEQDIAAIVREAYARRSLFKGIMQVLDPLLALLDQS